MIQRAAGVIVAAALLAVAPPARADAPPATLPAATLGEPIILIDLRPGDDAARRASRGTLAERLGTINGIVVKRDLELDAALAGASADADERQAAAAVDAAGTAFGQLDCVGARTAADHAIELDAGRQAAVASAADGGGDGHRTRTAADAAGADVGRRLRKAWTYVLLCADQGADADSAATAAARLRGLGVVTADDAGLPAATWARYPEVDAATDRDIVEVAIDTTPTGAQVWIDHAAAGTAPLTVFLPAGHHIVAAASATGARLGQRVAVDGKRQAVSLALVERGGAWAPVATAVASWRSGTATADAPGLTAIMRAAEVRFALVLAGASTVQVWALGPDDQVARKVDSGGIDDVLALSALVLDRVAAWDGNAPDPDVALLVEPRSAAAKPQQWWIYASIIGAVVVGASVIYLQDSATDHQRVVLRFP